MPISFTDQGRRASASGPEGLNFVQPAVYDKRASTQPAIRVLLPCPVVARSGGIHPAWLPRAAGLCHGAGTSLVGEGRPKPRLPTSAPGAASSLVMAGGARWGSSSNVPRPWRQGSQSSPSTRALAAPCVSSLPRPRCQPSPEISRPSPARTRRSGTPGMLRVPQRPHRWPSWQPVEGQRRSSTQDGEQRHLASAGGKLDEVHRRRHRGQQSHRVLQTGAEHIGRHLQGAL
jgi:hypothetical protein